MRAKFRTTEPILLHITKAAGLIMDTTKNFDGYDQGLLKYRIIAAAGAMPCEIHVNGNPMAISKLIGTFADSGIDCFMSATSGGC